MILHGRDDYGNTDEEVHDLFFDWLDEQCVVPQLFKGLPKITYSDLVVFYAQKYNNKFYGDLAFDIWYDEVYSFVDGV